MHDLMEGVIPNLLHKVIVRAVRNKTVTVDMLNPWLDEVSKVNVDCPNGRKHVSPSGSITDSAAQMWNLFLILPQILGRYVQEGNSAWEVYLLLRDVCDIVFSPVVLKSVLYFLGGLIFQFLMHFASEFDASSLTPKHHYMIHYPRLIGEYGPLRRLW